MSMHETVVITGASAGVGRATARAFARRGARIALLARGIDRLQAAADEVQREGSQALVLPTDVADGDAVEAAAAAVERRFGPIDIWVNDAMATIFALVQHITPEEFRRATEVTYLGAVYGTMAALKRMLPRDRGTIVQVGSALAYRAIPLQAPYCGAKHAIRGFTDSLRTELLHRKSHVHVTMVHLPALNTPQFDWGRNKMPRRPRPLGTIFQPEVAARAILDTAHARRREILVGGPTRLTVFVNKLLPGFMDRYLAKNAYSGQLSETPPPLEQQDNLFAPPEGDPGAHGRFDGAVEKESQRKLVVAAGIAGFIALAAALVWTSRAAARLR